jgi:shikimate kinase
MSAVQITGCSGAGKTSIAAMLARRGLAAIDADDDPLLARTVDAVGNVVVEAEEPDFAWLSQHSWSWNPGRLDELIRAGAPATLYVCGGADNEQALADRFTHVFLLVIDEPTMLARVDARQDNDWGRIGDTREYLRRKLRNCRTACAHSERSPSTPGSPLTRWWTRYSPTRLGKDWRDRHVGGSRHLSACPDDRDRARRISGE